MSVWETQHRLWAERLKRLLEHDDEEVARLAAVGWVLPAQHKVNTRGSAGSAAGPGWAGGRSDAVCAWCARRSWWGWGAAGLDCAGVGGGLVGAVRCPRHPPTASHFPAVPGEHSVRNVSGGAADLYTRRGVGHGHPHPAGHARCRNSGWRSTRSCPLGRARLTTRGRTALHPETVVRVAPEFDRGPPGCGGGARRGELGWGQPKETRWVRHWH